MLATRLDVLSTPQAPCVARVIARAVGSGKSLWGRAADMRRFSLRSMGTLSLFVCTRTERPQLQRQSAPSRGRRLLIKARAMFPACLAILLCCGVCDGKQIGLLILDSDTLVVSEAVGTVELPKGTTVSFFTLEEIEQNEKSRASFLGSDVMVVDVMDNRIVEYMDKNVDISKKRVYAVRGANQNDDLKSRGYIFDDEIRDFYHHMSERNVKNLILKVAHVEFFDNDATVYFGIRNFTDRQYALIGYLSPPSIYSPLGSYEGWFPNEGRTYYGGVKANLNFDRMRVPTIADLERMQRRLYGTFESAVGSVYRWGARIPNLANVMNTSRNRRE